jgi:hypothetical protein
MGEPYTEADVVPVIQAQRDVNCARGLPSVRKEGIRDATAAIVGFGPSLIDTVDGLRGFEAIWTVSKAHDFIIKRGIIPTHHTDVDYREHKAHYNRLWGPDTRYVMATQVHPTYLNALAWHHVELFHVVQPNGGLYDPRYYKCQVAFDAGLQAARVAYELGYRNQHWFGMDASIEAAGTHAGPHEGWGIIEKQDGEALVPIPVEIAGKVRTMNAFLLRQALFAERMLRELPRLKVTIRGAGALRPFLQERGKCRVS